MCRKMKWTTFIEEEELIFVSFLIYPYLYQVLYNLHNNVKQFLKLILVYLFQFVKYFFQFLLDKFDRQYILYFLEHIQLSQDLYYIFLQFVKVFCLLILHYKLNQLLNKIKLNQSLLFTIFKC